MSCFQRNLLHSVRKRNLDDQGMNLFLSYFLPCAIRRPSIACIKKSSPSFVLDQVPRGVNGMIDRMRGDGVILDFYGMTGLQSDKVKNGVMAIGKNRKIRPNRAIQQTLSNRLNHRRDAQDVHPIPLFSENKIVSQKRNSHDMVEVGMGNEDVLDLQLGFDIQNIGEATRIKYYLVT